jgi:hypothetical protein
LAQSTGLIADSLALKGSRYPDLVIGFMIAVLVSRGGFQILREARTLPVAKKDE